MSYVTKDSKFTDPPIEDIHRHVVPYQHREYPRHLHQGAGDTYTSKIVNSDEEKAAAVKAGWFLDANEAALAAAAADAGGVVEAGGKKSGKK